MRQTTGMTGLVKRRAVGAVLAGLSALALTGTAQAHGFPVTVIRTTTITDPHARKAEELQPATCPAGVPVQTITVVNQANVRTGALAKVERAMADQSMQLRAAWGTPCVQFGPGGWPVYLRVGSYEGAYDGHYVDPAGAPWATVATSGTAYQAWSSSFSHELIEMLVDPATTRNYTHNPESGNLEVADPVEDSAYRLDGTWVSDFVLPAWYAGGTDGVCETDATPGADGQWVDTIQCNGNLIAAGDALGPYDEMGILAAPWSGEPG